MTDTPSWRLRLARRLAAGYTAEQLGVSVRIDDSPGWTNFYGLPNDRALAEMQELYADALKAWRMNPIAKRITDIITDYTIGKGITPAADFQPLNDFAQAFWNHPQNHMADRLVPISEELSRAGDVFPVLFRNPHDGMSYVRFVIKSQIYEVITAANDWETELSYTQIPANTHLTPITWHNPAHPDAPNQTAVMLHFHINRPLGATLGESDLATMIPWLLKYSRMLDDRVRLHAAARTFLWDVEVPDAQVAAKQAQYADMPESGSVIVRSPGEKWAAITPNLRGADATHDMEALRQMIQAGSGFPAHWMGDSGNANLATATAMQAPAERHLARRQRELAAMLETTITAAYTRQPNAAPIPATGPQWKTAVPDIGKDDNLPLAQAASALTTSLSQLVMETPSSPTLLRAYLENIFKFMGEPQAPATLDKIVDEMMKGANKTAEGKNEQ